MAFHVVYFMASCNKSTERPNSLIFDLWPQNVLIFFYLDNLCRDSLHPSLTAVQVLFWGFIGIRRYILVWSGMQAISINFTTFPTTAAAPCWNPTVFGVCSAVECTYGPPYRRYGRWLKFPQVKAMHKLHSRSSARDLCVKLSPCNV